MMTNRLPLRTLRSTSRLSGVTTAPVRSFSSRTSPFRYVKTPITYFLLPAPRNFQTTARQYAGLMPDTENPVPRDTQDHETSVRPAEQTEEEFHERADRFFNDLTEKLEQMQEQDSGLEVEYSAGVLNIELGVGGETRNYVLNKQPPNKQIWLSSPVSGPKRFDWVVTGEGMNQKEGAGQGDWVYMRDGTSLTELLRKEVGVSVGMEPDEGT